MRSFRDQTDLAKFDQTNKQSGSGYEVTWVMLRELRTELRNLTFTVLISEVVNSFWKTKDKLPYEINYHLE